MKKLVAICFALVLASACIVKETENTLYLAPDGALVWTILESDVHSESSEEQERSAQETAFLKSRQDSSSELEQALALLGGEAIRTVVLREQAPFAVWTEARFIAADRLLNRVLEELGLFATARLWTEGEITTLELIIDTAQIEAADLPGNELVVNLLVGLEDPRIVLTSGTFVAATGFELIDEGRVAIPLAPDEDEPLPEQLVYRLSWPTAIE